MSTATPSRPTTRAILEGLRERPSAFNAAVLGRPGYWDGQCKIARSVVKHHATLVPTGNMVGKTYLAAGLVHWFLFTRPQSIVLATAPSQTQLEEVLWKEVEQAYRGAKVPLGGRALRSPLKIDLKPGWHALAYSTTRMERLSGHHAGDLFVVVDEASGVDEEIFDALRSCGPSRELLIGNPLRPDGTFADRCRAAADNPMANVVHLDSRDGPHATLERSPWGLADLTWLATVRNDYGEGSLWWKSHVEGVFPDEASDTLVPRPWVDAAARATHLVAGPRRLAVDLAEGRDGDRSVLLCRDDNGVLDLEASARWDFQATATKAALMAQRWGVAPGNVTYDATGIGADFHNRLTAVGIEGARAYRGGASSSRKFSNLRSAAAWLMRQRLDPNRTIEHVPGVPQPQVPFAIRKDWCAMMRDELVGLRYSQASSGAVELEPKADLAQRLRRSPDLADALIISYAFP